MTYKLDPSIEKIISPVILTYPNGWQQEFTDGKAVMEQNFSEKYSISSIRAKEHKVQIVIRTVDSIDADISFF